jgi:hypothetical protein
MYLDQRLRKGSDALEGSSARTERYYLNTDVPKRMSVQIS